MEELIQRKLMHIQAVLTNPNYDDGETDKNKVIFELEKHYDNVIDYIWTGEKPDSEKEVDFAKIPLMAGMRLPDEIERPHVDQEMVQFGSLKDLMDEPMQEM